MKRLPLLFLLLLPVALCAQRADDTDPGREKSLSPYFWVRNTAPGVEALPLKSTSVEASISGVIADVRVTQVYANTGTTPIEALYVFPGSTRAAVHGLSFTLGERRIEAQIKERRQARKIYETARTSGRTATLLEQQRPNVFQMNVANILPGDEVRVELRYTELLVPSDGVYEFVLPGVVGPRYTHTPAANAAPDDEWTRTPIIPRNGEDPAAFSLAVRCATGGVPILGALSPTHRTQIDHDAPDLVRVTLSPSETNAANRDFILRYRLAGDRIQTGLLLSEGEDENFFLAMIQPPARPAPDEMPPRDYLFVVDVSGSMRGFPLQTARRLLESLFPTLRPQDRFNILLFSGDSRMLAPASLPATPQNLANALRLLDGMNGAGGTELLPALRAAFSQPRADGLSRIISIITDGYVTVETEAFDLVRSRLDKASVFAFGIGSSVNRHLIEGLARAGQGEPFIVTHPGEAEDAAARFRDYIATPVLAGARVRFDGFDAYDIAPRAVPDLFAQRPVVLFGKWRGPKSGLITLTGSTGSQPFSATLDVAAAATLPADNGLARLWARHRIRELSDDISVQSNDERIAAVTTLGLTYSLLTRYTSFVAVDKVVRTASGDPASVRQPLPLPQGVEATAVGGDIPTSPEPAAVMLLGVGALLAAVLFWRRQRGTR